MTRRVRKAIFPVAGLGYLEAIVHSALANSEFGPNFEAFLRQMSQQREFAAE